ncbi:phosphomannomutase/phosphoglucomutase [Sulfurimonas sp. HSL-1656]|uniref:phosphomannomutase/phosphoglucomutase n=1 Tax=Thiomicrolovo subterrani TaxID=3131934 RepID=UPI0031F997C6
MSIFREYDIRGIVPGELNEETVTKIGFALAGKIDGEYVAVGYDARMHSPELFGYLAAGLNAGGKTVLAMDLVPTPVNYFANYQSFEGKTPSASVMITGSHNPSEYNGFKITVAKAPFFGEQIYALGDEVAAMGLPPKAETRIIEVDVKARYIDYMVEQFSHLKGMKEKIVYDCGNGAAGVVVPEIFSRLELDARGLYVDPDGTFPNHHPDPSVEKNLADVKAALAAEGDIAFAYDGDADRIAVLTKKYNIKGDQMALLFSMGMENPTVIGEVKCSQVMYDTLKARGATPVMYKTGHSNLKVKIKELNADLACEVSGHVFFNDRYFGYDDAIYGTLRMLELVHEGIDLDAELDKLPPVFSTEEIKVETTEQEKFPLMAKLGEMLQNPPADFPAISEIITVDGVRVIFENGWGLVRASNTTPVLVTRFESPDLEDAKRYEKALNDLIAEAKKALNE